MSNFSDFPLEDAILQSLNRMGYAEPSEIQAAAIPYILQKKDLIALAQTGSGKTAACAIPVCNNIRVDMPQIQALIIVPTRELALQYATETQKIGHDKGVKTFALFGGKDYSLQEAKLKHGVHILVATPGRLIDYIYGRQIDLSNVSCLILDEADEMLSMGFYDDLEFIIQCLVHEHQTLLFSATMPKQIALIAKQHMKDPIELIINKKNHSPTSIDHKFIYCRHDQRENKLIELLKQINPTQSIVFCHSRHQVDQLCKALQKNIKGVDLLHAGLTQDLRTVITSKFRRGQINHLVATDVAARGLDFSGVTHVFIFQLSNDIDTYLHRAGRTGRYEKEGSVISFVTDREMSTLREVVKRLGSQPAWIGDPPPARSSKALPRRYIQRRKVE